MPLVDPDMPYYPNIISKTQKTKKVLSTILERYIFHLEHSSFSDSYIRENQWLDERKHGKRALRLN
jgi:hypothetical protein